jgi:chromosome segregation ATPase
MSTECSTIDQRARSLEKSYERTLRRIKRLKGSLNTLEETTRCDKGPGNAGRMKALDSAAGSLNRLSDSLIARSKKAWQIYERLEHKCKATGLEMTRLSNVQVLCKKTEAMAADLLCYMLGRLRHRERLSD